MSKMEKKGFFDAESNTSTVSQASFIFTSLSRPSLSNPIRHITAQLPVLHYLLLCKPTFSLFQAYNQSNFYRR
jgi:hypothetical protein